MPEEINRILTDHASDYLFCPTTDAVKNLSAENIINGVHHVGDIMYDAVKTFVDKFYLQNDIKLQRDKKLAVMTVHRADTTSDAKLLQEVISFCNSYSDEYQVIFLVHPNTKNKLKEFAISTGEIILMDPLSYSEMQGLLKKTDLVLTDSGGLQKEAYFHGCDCITLRDETEWVETLHSGWNRLWKQSGKGVPHSKNNINEYGDGNACNKILSILRNSDVTKNIF